MLDLADELSRDPMPDTRPASSRSSRFTGESQRCQLTELTADSRLALHCLYDWLESIGRHVDADPGSHALRAALLALLDEERLDAAASWARSLAPVTSSPRLTRILHDVRGAALHQVISLASRDDRALNRDELRAIVIWARDHAKVLRHMVLGLDDDRRRTDVATRRHGVANLRTRLPVLLLAGGREPIAVTFAAACDDDFAETCPEFSTVLRQIYHLLDNAARYAVDGHIYVGAYPKPAGGPAAVRIVVANAIGDAQRAQLTSARAQGLWRGFSTTGGGVGLAASADLVSEAFGLDGAEQAIREGYVGSRVSQAGYLAWLHWPVLAGASAATADVS